MRLVDADALAAKIMMDAPDFMDGGSSITKAFILAMVNTRSERLRLMLCKLPGARIAPLEMTLILMFNHTLDINVKKDTVLTPAIGTAETG